MSFRQIMEIRLFRRSLMVSSAFIATLVIYKTPLILTQMCIVHFLRVLLASHIIYLFILPKKIPICTAAPEESPDFHPLSELLLLLTG